MIAILFSLLLSDAPATIPAIPQELQVKVTLAALDASQKMTAEQEANRVLGRLVSEMRAVCGDKYEVKNDLTHFWCEPKAPQEKP